jgi:hypothetical protein
MVICTVLSENGMTTSRLQMLCNSNEVRDEFDLSASDNLMAPTAPRLSSVLSENQMKQKF